MPLHMIFRAGSLMANMMMGIALLGKRYSPLKYLSVLMITLGIVTCTYSSTASRAPEEEASRSADDDRFWTFVGIGLLTFALFMSARMGIYQEVIYNRHGKHPKEALFYTHALPLPGFLLLAPDILHHWGIVMASPAVSVLGLHLPSMLLYLLGNIATQYLCISAVFVLTTECASLTVTLVVTLRYFTLWYSITLVLTNNMLLSPHSGTSPLHGTFPTTLGVGETIFLKTRQDKKWTLKWMEFETRNGKRGERGCRPEIIVD